MVGGLPSKIFHYETVRFVLGFHFLVRSFFFVALNALCILRISFLIPHARFARERIPSRSVAYISIYSFLNCWWKCDPLGTVYGKCPTFYWSDGHVGRNSIWSDV